MDFAVVTHMKVGTDISKITVTALWNVSHSTDMHKMANGMSSYELMHILYYG
jgi:hypothetical protein